ncbi:MAG: cysteine synthase A [Acidobacteriia bacterium]|nr:cysteine synthase A [Terriglobia bacterium]
MSAVLVPCPTLLTRIGNTPLFELSPSGPAAGATIFAKAEFMNPGGSVKDRIAQYIIERAEDRGDLKPGSTILEVTSGNTGIALSMVGAQKGYRVVIIMPRTASVERRKMIEAFGAELELIDDVKDIERAVADTEDRAGKDPTIFLPRQFSNPDNPAAHTATTGREILNELGSDVDAFVMGVGTGGTLMGVGEALRRANRRVQIVAVEPAESAVISGQSPGDHGIQGIADGFIPPILKVEKVDQVVKVPTQEAIRMAKRLAREQALFVGISAGANVVAAQEVARALGPGKNVVTILPDRGERYLSVW